MKKIKKFISMLSICAVMGTCYSVNAFAQTDVSKNEFNAFRNLATTQLKVLDVSKYEIEMENAKSVKEKLEVSKKYQSYMISSQTTYYDSNGKKIGSINEKAVPGDIKIEKNEFYGGGTEYDRKSNNTLANFLKLTIDISMSWSHPAAGVLYTMLNGMIPEVEYSTYSGVIARILHDYKINEKYVYVYKLDPMTSKYSWEPMVFASKKDTSAQSNLVYYRNSIRQEPTNLDLGLIRIESGNNFHDDARLKSLAKSATSPISFPYTYGASVYYTNPELLKY